MNLYAYMVNYCANFFTIKRGKALRLYELYALYG